MSDAYVIGVDLGGTNLKVALLDSRFRIIHKRIESTVKYRTQAELISAIANGIRLARQQAGRKRVVAAGIGLPGPVDEGKGIVHFLPNISGWKNVPLRRLLEKKTGLPIAVDNDANCMCLAEAALGAAKGAVNAVCITLGTGVGGGIIINSQLYRGKSNITGEVGHMPIGVHGPKCNCGGTACLEAYIGNNRILAQARRVFGSKATLESASAAAARGEKKAIALWQDVGRKLGAALTGIINLLNPDCVVIGGGVANAGDVLLDAVRREVAARAMPVQAKDVRIRKARLGYDSGMIGAGVLARSCV